MHETEGSAGLDPKPNAGSKPRLSKKEKNRLRRILVEGATRHGFGDETWTLRRVRAVIEREFGVRYHVSHVHRLLLALGFSSQKPMRRARERNQAAVDFFRTRTWKRLKKKPAGRAAR